MNKPNLKQLLLGSVSLIVTGIGYNMLISGSPVKPLNTDQASHANSPQMVAVNESTSEVSPVLFDCPAELPQDENIIIDDGVELCQGFEVPCQSCASGGDCVCGQPQVAAASYAGDFNGINKPYRSNAVKHFAGVNEHTRGLGVGEPSWRNAKMIPWEAFAYGEYIGPHRTPHVAEYRLRVADQLEFIYILTREKSPEAYRFYVGDTISISSAIDSSINVPTIAIQNDGAISLTLIGQVRVAGKTIDDLQRELNDRYSKYFQNPSIVVQVIQGDTPLQDLLDSVDARAGTGGQSRTATVSPDGTVQLPLIGSVPALGLSLDEIEREVNARYRMKLAGISVTPVLTERAPRFIYVVGQVGNPGQFTLTGPTTAMQAIALAGGELVGGNLRQVIVFRRDQNWRLTATKLDLNGAILGKRPHPSDEIWLRDSDIVLIPRSPIRRLSDQVNLYLSSTLYSIFPQQGVAFNFDDFTSL